MTFVEDKKDVKPAGPKLPSKSFLFALLAAVTSSQLMYLNIASFLPTHARLNHSTLAATEMGIILAMYQVARLLLSTTIGGTMSKFGKKNYMMVGFCLFILASLGFAGLGLMEGKSTKQDDITDIDGNDIWFFVGAIILNFIQGMGGACL